MTLYESISLFLEFGVLIILVVEYFWGRPDIVMRNEAKRKRQATKQIRFETLIVGEHK